MIAGRYSLDREIGRGGMGAVWLARDEVLGREVALKRIGLLPGADTTDLARAEREARLAARLNHPHVVAVFDLVLDPETGARWLVMEYVAGATLAQLVQNEGSLSPDDAAALLWQAADALADAHEAGIVHRDVKPSNILVTPEGRVKLTDFGIARIAGDPSLTQTGLVTGSPAYLAPELATGDRGDAAVDVWSLGATLFYVLSGRTPYDAGDHVLGGLYRVVNEEPPRLPDAGWLAPLLEATMVKDPSRRWPMTQVRDFLAGRSPLPTIQSESLPPSPPPAARAAAARPRRKGLFAGLVGLSLVLVLGLVLLVVLPGHSPTTSKAGNRPSASSSPSPSRQSASSSPTPSHSRRPVAPAPTASGMKSFIRDYVAAVSSDPGAAWHMLTPKFQRESGGLKTYRKFWDGVGHGRILSITADPNSLVVSYHVRFEHFGTGRRPTVLHLVYRDGHYLIDGERTRG